MKPGHRYRLSGKGFIFEIMEINSNTVTIENITTKDIFRYSLEQFKSAISSKKIVYIRSDTKQKSKLIKNDSVSEYIRQREEIFNAENKDKAT